LTPRQWPNAVRLIGLSKLYGLWLARMIQSRREAQQYRLSLSFRKDKVMEEIKKDPVIADLLTLHEKFTKTRDVITNPGKTGFYFVTTPESLPISVVLRFIKMVESFNIPVGGVFVNNIIDPKDVETDPSGYLRSKMEEQQHYLNIIMEKMGDKVMGYVRSFPTEIRGLDGVKTVVGELRGYTPPHHTHAENSLGWSAAAMQFELFTGSLLSGTYNFLTLTLPEGWAIQRTRIPPDIYYMGIVNGKRWILEGFAAYLW
jgi:anion-transporting  ArsA/GET3 family ATPase